MALEWWGEHKAAPCRLPSCGHIVHLSDIKSSKLSCSVCGDGSPVQRDPSRDYVPSASLTLAMGAAHQDPSPALHRSGYGASIVFCHASSMHLLFCKQRRTPGQSEHAGAHVLLVMDSPVPSDVRLVVILTNHRFEIEVYDLM